MWLCVFTQFFQMISPILAAGRPIQKVRKAAARRQTVAPLPANHPRAGSGSRCGNSSADQSAETGPSISVPLAWSSISIASSRIRSCVLAPAFRVAPPTPPDTKPGQRGTRLPSLALKGREDLASVSGTHSGFRIRQRYRRLPWPPAGSAKIPLLLSLPRTLGTRTWQVRSHGHSRCNTRCRDGLSSS